MKQVLVFRLDNTSVLTLDIKYKGILLFYYVDILDQKDIIYYLYNNDLHCFIDKFLIIEKESLFLKSISLNVDHYIELSPITYFSYVLTELNSEFQIHDDFYLKYNNPEDIILEKLFFSYDSNVKLESFNNYYVFNDNDLVQKLFKLNKMDSYYIVYKNEKFYLKSILYSNIFEKQISIDFINRIESIDVELYIYKEF